MPRFDYECEACGSVKEVSHGMSEHPEITCDDLVCGANGSDTTRFQRRVMRKLISTPAIVFKGSGFYCTDARKIITASDVHGKGIETGPNGVAK